MSKAMAFWDASALVPLCVYQTASSQAHAYIRKLAPVVWWGSVVEVHSAISRLNRTGELTNIEKKGALARLAKLSRGWREILPVDQVRNLATQLLDSYELKAVDALQLAAALTWCQQRTSKTNFVCCDQKLAQAAKTAGFFVLPM
jgi:predicted nucleic acid-binding protein